MARRMLVVLLLVFAVNYMDRQLLAILIEPIKRDVGISDTAGRRLQERRRMERMQRFSQPRQVRIFDS